MTTQQVDITKLKPSELIRHALQDLTKCEQSVNYEINMFDWHRPIEGENKCHVCMAGAVMAQTLDASPYLGHDPLSYDQEIERVLRAIDALRVGQVNTALVNLGYTSLTDSDNPYVAPYRLYDPDRFHQAMNRLADYLESKNL